MHEKRMQTLKHCPIRLILLSSMQDLIKCKKHSELCAFWWNILWIEDFSVRVTTTNLSRAIFCKSILKLLEVYTRDTPNTSNIIQFHRNFYEETRWRIVVHPRWGQVRPSTSPSAEVKNARCLHLENRTPGKPAFRVIMKRISCGRSKVLSTNSLINCKTVFEKSTYLELQHSMATA